MSTKTLNELLDELDPNGEHIMTPERYKKEMAEIEAKIFTKYGIPANEIEAAVRDGRLNCNHSLQDEWIELKVFEDYLDLEDTDGSQETEKEG